MSTESKFLRNVCEVVFRQNLSHEPVNETQLDEEKLFHLGLYHQILPLIGHYRVQLQKAFPNISPAFLEKCRQFTMTNAGRVMLYERILAKLDDLLRSEDIEYRLFKGPVLAFALYDYPHLRTFGDIDILIREHALEKVHRLLKSLNCELCDDLYTVFPDEIIKKYKFARHYVTVKPPFVAVDVHLSLSGRLHPFQFDIEDFWEHSRPYRIGNREYLTFDFTYQALYSLYHAFKHYFYKLIWIIDCRRLFERPDFDRFQFEYLIQKYGLMKIRDIYDHVADGLWREKSEEMLPSRRQKRRLIPGVDADLILQGSMPISPSRARMLLPLLYLPKFRQKIVYLWRQMFPPRDVVRDFYISRDLRPTWRNYLSLRRRAVYELFND
jgi:hypothetical protein